MLESYRYRNDLEMAFLWQYSIKMYIEYLFNQIKYKANNMIL